MRTAMTTILTLGLLCTGATAVAAQETDMTMPETAPSVYLTGTWTDGPAHLPDPLPNPETGILEMRDGSIEFMVQSEDPRIDGPYRIDPIHMDIDPNTGIGRMWGTGHIVRDDGAFEGPFRGFTRPISEGVDAYTGSGWYTGSGAFEGLSYYYRATFDGETPFYEALIFEGEVPPAE